MSYSYSENKVDLVINKVSRSIYKQLQDNEEIRDTEVYSIIDPILSVSIGYDTNSKKITLLADNIVSEIDATHFIKDGMLSAVSYDKPTNKLVLSFNTDAGVSPISVNLSSLVDVYTAGNGLTAVNNQFRINENIVTTKTVATQISSDLNQKIGNKVTFRYWSEA